MQLTLKGSSNITAHFRGKGPRDIFCPQLNAKLNTRTYTEIAVYKMPSVMLNVLEAGEVERNNVRYTNMW